MNSHARRCDGAQLCRVHRGDVQLTEVGADPRGSPVIRLIGPGDADRAQAFVRTLLPETRYFRFFQALKELSPRMLAGFTCIDHRTHMALVAVALTEGRETIVGEARYSLNADGASAEIAIVVADTWQRRGLATRLLQTLELAAAANGVAHFTGETLAGNTTFVSFARVRGFTLRPDREVRSLLRLEKSIGSSFSLLHPPGQ